MIMYYFCIVTSFIVVHLLNAQKSEILHDFQKKCNDAARFLLVVHL